MLIAQGIACFLHRVFYLLADIGTGIDHQFFSGEQNLDLVDAADLADRILYFAGAGCTVHACHFPGIAGT